MSWSMIENYAESGTVYILADIGYDISTLPTNFPSGTICYVMDDSAKYRLSPSGVWARVELDYVPEVYPDQECEHPTYYVISKNNAVSKEVLIESESDLEDVPKLVGILYRLSDSSASYKYSPAGNYFVKMAKRIDAVGMQFYKVTFNDSTDKFVGPDGSELNFAALVDKYNDDAYFLFCEYQSVTYIPSLPPVEDPIHPDRVLEFVATWVYGGDVNVSRLAINENEQVKNETFVVGGGGSEDTGYVYLLSFEHNDFTESLRINACVKTEKPLEFNASRMLTAESAKNLFVYYDQLLTRPSFLATGFYSLTDPIQGGATVYVVDAIKPHNTRVDVDAFSCAFVCHPVDNPSDTVDFSIPVNIIDGSIENLSIKNNIVKVY